VKNKRESLMRELDVLTQPMNKQGLEVSELTLVASFRYALGRKTYVVSAIVENILKNWSSLSIKFKAKIKEEIQEAIKKNNAGSDIDIEQWNTILEKDDEIVFTKKDPKENNRKIPKTTKRRK
jgi:molybdopterin converting factor small subunit